MSEVQKTSSSTFKNHESRKASISPNNPPSRKQSRKGDNPVRLLPTEQSSEFGYSNSWICKNSACRACLSIADTFCRRCSCCICHLYDDNKDPSLWLVCSSDSGNIDSCGLSCHIECALRQKKVGVVDLGHMMQLDGSYCCASCGKVSGILGYWKKQLEIAKDARRVDVLCYRIFLSCRLLNGTSRFKDLLQIVNDAREKLETEVGPLGDSANLARGIVSRLHVAGDVLKLCSQAIEKADEWLTSISDANPNCRDSLPAACRFLFEEVKTCSLKIILIESPSLSSGDIKGYKLWYWRNREESQPKEPICAFPRNQRRITISNLQPCTEYTFRIVSYTADGDLGHSEAKCFTKSAELVYNKNHTKENPLVEGRSAEKRTLKTETEVDPSSGFKVRDLGNALHQGQVQKEEHLDGLCTANTEKHCRLSKPNTREEKMSVVPRELDLNVASVPDLNEELTPPFDSSRDEDTDLVASHGSGDSQTWTNNAQTREAPAFDSQPALSKKKPGSTEEAHESGSTLINGSPFHISDGSGGLNENFEYCVKIIRWLECEGHINKEFRLKLLTWFSLRSTDQERRVVNTFIQNLIDDPSSLAGQLVDSFSDVLSSKRQRNGFCTVLC